MNKLLILALVGLVGCTTASITAPITVVEEPYDVIDYQPNISPVVQKALVIDPFITLTWTAPNDIGIAGYNIYWGTKTDNYTNHVTVSGVTNLTATITGLVPSVKYFFAATAFRVDGQESIFSNETSYTVPLGIDEIVLTVYGQFAVNPAGPYVSFDAPIFVGTNVSGMQYFRTIMIKTVNHK